MKNPDTPSVTESGLSPREQADRIIDTNPQKALRLYESAAGAGDALAAYRAAVMYAENIAIRPNETRAAALMAQAADAGHPAAMADYGLLVYQGLVPGSAEDAVNWFARAAKGGDDQGKFLYAFSLAKGEGVAQDFEEAYYWLLLTKPSGVAIYDQDVIDLRERLEANVDPVILEAAEKRAAQDKS